jgi:hypothetical protein
MAFVASVKQQSRLGRGERDAAGEAVVRIAGGGRLVMLAALSTRGEQEEVKLVVWVLDQTVASLDMPCAGFEATTGAEGRRYC